MQQKLTIESAFIPTLKLQTKMGATLTIDQAMAPLDKGFLEGLV